MVSDTVIVNGAVLDNAANLQEDEFSTNEFVHSARILGYVERIVSIRC
jgi:hypothetical protein